MDAIRGRARNALARLGSTSEAIAQNLRELNIRGHVGEGTCCPLANYLSPRLELPVDVLDDGVVVGGETYLWGWTAPEQFVREFDAGRFSYLVEPDRDQGEREVITP